MALSLACSEAVGKARCCSALECGSISYGFKHLISLVLSIPNGKYSAPVEDGSE